MCVCVVCYVVSFLSSKKKLFSKWFPECILVLLRLCAACGQSQQTQFVSIGFMPINLPNIENFFYSQLDWKLSGQIK